MIKIIVASNLHGHGTVMAYRYPIQLLKLNDCAKMKVVHSGCYECKWIQTIPNDTKPNESKTKWYQTKWNETKPNEMKWNEIKWNKIKQTK